MDVKVSTQSFLAHTNMSDLNLEKLFDEITPTVELTYMAYKQKEIGKKVKKRKSKNFSNCISFSFFFDDKNIALKLFRNGLIQNAGCKSREHCEKVLVFLWTVLKETPSCSSLNSLNVSLVSVMRNATSNLGFRVDGEKLEKYFFENHNLIATINGNFTTSRFNVPVGSVEDMPVYKFEISGKNNKISSRREITYEKFCVLTGRERAGEKILL